MRKLCYTACIGNYDHILPPVKTEGWHYLLITDDPKLEVEGWESLYMGPLAEGFDAKLHARNWKIIAPWGPDYDLSVWCDGSITPQCNLDKFVEQHHKKDLTVMKHPGWESLTTELQKCSQLMKDDPEVMVEQVKGYFEEGYPDVSPMVATGLMIRTHTDEVEEFCRQWWGEVSTKSIRDQLSFNYIAWKLNFDFGYMPWGCIQGPFKQRNHKR